MKIKIALAGLCLALCAFSFAQEVTTDNEEVGSETTFKPNRIWSDCFVLVALGGQTFLGDFSKSDGMMSRMTLMPSFAIAKWWSPYWGTRLQLQGGALHTFPRKTFMQKDTYFNPHLDAMCNLSQYLEKYISCSVVNFIPYAGLGFYWRGAASKDNRFLGKSAFIYYPEGHAGMTVHAGALLQFRINDAIACHLDVAGTLLTDDYLNRWVGGMRYEGIFSVSLGLILSLEELLP